MTPRGDCPHGDDREWCVVCLREEVAATQKTLAEVREDRDFIDADPMAKYLRYWRDRAKAAETEVATLRGIIDGMAARVASQADALSRRAEKGTP